eukprot:365969-Chlamydomonas_euryale.AAC.1
MHLHARAATGGVGGGEASSDSVGSRASSSSSSASAAAAAAELPGALADLPPGLQEQLLQMRLDSVVLSSLPELAQRVLQYAVYEMHFAMLYRALRRHAVP